MSEGAAEAAAAAAAAEEGANAEAAEALVGGGEFSFGAIMDVLAPDTGAEGAGEGAAEAAGATGASGGAAAEGATGGTGSAPDAGALAPGATGPLGGTAAPGAGATGSADPDAGATGGTGATGDSGGAGATGVADGGRPASWTVPAADVLDELGGLSAKFEESVAAAYQAEALTALKEEHPKYFEAIEKPPQLLVGTKVPALDGQGEVTLRDTAAAREWQEGIKYTLVEELRGRANAELDKNKDFLTTVHSSIEIFTKNKDLIPGTADFNVDLANRFVAFVKPYEIRSDEGKLLGYSIPVQPIVDQLRQQPAAAAQEPQSPPAGATGATGAEAPPGATAAAQAPAEPPQAGIPSKAGSSGDEPEDFSVLFGTIGLPSLKI